MEGDGVKMVKDHLLYLLVYFLRWRGKESGKGEGRGGEGRK